jgi:SAM-dependent methyltransferase
VDVERDVLRRGLATAPERVLEAGCGRRDSVADSLAPYRGSIREVVGVDVDEAAARDNPALDRVVAADLCSPLPFDEGAFDLVYASFVVEHLADPPAAFVEWRRILRPGGTVLVVTPNIANPLMRVAGMLPHRWKVALKRAGPGVAERDVTPTVYAANTPTRLAALAARSGLVPVELRCVATLHRYAGRRAWLRGAFAAAERPLPAGRRSTIVALFRRRAV